MKLTEAGQALYRQSRSLFLNLRRVEENVRSIGAGEGGRINVGVIYSAMPYALHYLEAYHARYPKVEFYIRLGSPQDLLNDLDRGELHVLFLRRSTQESGSLHERILGEDALELIMTAATDPAPELDAVPIERLRGVPMCLLRSDDLWGYNDYLMKECRRSGFEPERALPVLRYAHGDAARALGLRHQLPAALHRRDAPELRHLRQASARHPRQVLPCPRLERRRAGRALRAAFHRGILTGAALLKKIKRPETKEKENLFTPAQAHGIMTA